MTKNKFVFSDFLNSKTLGQKIAIIAMVVAINVVGNAFLEYKYFDIQFSLTILLSCVTGYLLGPLSGFVCCVLADFIGYIINSWGQLYMPWVGVSTGMIALISGLVFIKYKTKPIVSTLLIALTTFVFCTVLINSTGFYFYNKIMGFSTAVLNYARDKFGGNVGYFSYLAYRLIFKGQIFNSLANYFLLYFVLLALNKIKF